MPLAFWLTFAVTGIGSGVVAWLVLKQAQPHWFDPAKRNFRGQTPGSYVVSMLAAACAIIAMLAWLWYLRRRGWHGFEKPRRKKEPGNQ